MKTEIKQIFQILKAEKVILNQTTSRDEMELVRQNTNCSILKIKDQMKKKIIDIENSDCTRPQKIKKLNEILIELEGSVINKADVGHFTIKKVRKDLIVSVKQSLKRIQKERRIKI